MFSHDCSFFYLENYIVKENGQENKFVQILVSTFDSGLSFIGKKKTLQIYPSQLEI